ncbi:hypothetical protein ACFQPB_22290 [Hydrogenophaga atypica]|uniref:Uncharacterized protein n=1 Tax=Hydrogenophaga atypica TaxID=249409 RepID=A0ABW2QW79_9BURK
MSLEFQALKFLQANAAHRHVDNLLLGGRAWCPVAAPLICETLGEGAGGDTRTDTAAIAVEDDSPRTPTQSVADMRLIEPKNNSCWKSTSLSGCLRNSSGSGLRLKMADSAVTGLPTM